MALKDGFDVMLKAYSGTDDILLERMDGAAESDVNALLARTTP
jgi:hypothetical protein